MNLDPTHHRCRYPRVSDQKIAIRRPRHSHEGGHAESSTPAPPWAGGRGQSSAPGVLRAGNKVDELDRLERFMESSWDERMPLDRAAPRALRRCGKRPGKSPAEPDKEQARRAGEREAVEIGEELEGASRRQSDAMGGQEDERVAEEVVCCRRCGGGRLLSAGLERLQEDGRTLEALPFSLSLSLPQLSLLTHYSLR